MLPRLPDEPAVRVSFCGVHAVPRIGHHLQGSCLLHHACGSSCEGLHVEVSSLEAKASRNENPTCNPSYALQEKMFTDAKRKLSGKELDIFVVSGALLIPIARVDCFSP